MLSVIILAAGKGSRTNLSTNKPLIEIADQPMVKWVYERAKLLQPQQIIIVTPKDNLNFKQAINDETAIFATQEYAKGTADAVKCAIPSLLPGITKILILCADVPFVRLEELQALCREQSICILTSIPQDPGNMGRVKRNNYAEVNAIIEASDANAEEISIPEVFSGIMQCPKTVLKDFLEQVDNNNAQQEYYLTKIVNYAIKKSITVSARTAMPAWQVQGVNTLIELVELERTFYVDKAKEFLAAGVRIIDANRFDCRGNLSCGKDVTIDINIVIKGEVTIGSNCYIGPGCILENTKIGDNCKIFAHSVIIDSNIDINSSIGPFAYLRPGSEVYSNCRVGSFVEIKNSRIGRNTKIPHLSYIGDSDLGCFVNIGAGVITCNYNGKQKHKTIIEDYCFIGAGVQLIAPIKVHAAAVIGAGTCLRKDVKSKSLAVNKYEVTLIDNWNRG